MLVNDYLERRLAELNRQRVSDGTPWLLVQPSGAFPLVGPVFNPGQGRLLDMSVRSHDPQPRGQGVSGPRTGARRSRSHRWPAIRSVKARIQFAALEIAKAIASGFRTDLNNHIISHDLLGSTTVKHYVAHRPQCPTCGSKKLRDPRRAPTPIELGPGAKLMMTSGGYRTVSSRATVARFRKHVSPLTGVVTRLERIEADLPMNTNYFAAHNFSAPALNVDELREGLTGGSFGKGWTAEQAEASALMEAIERYSGIFQGDEIRVTRRFTDFAPGRAINPKDVLLFSDAQYESHQRPSRTTPTKSSRPGAVRSIGQDRMVAGLVAARQRFRYLPTSLLYFFYGGPDRLPCRFQRLRCRQYASRKPSSRASSNWWSAMPTRSGGTIGFAARGSRSQPVRRFLCARSAEPARRRRAQALGARCHQRSRRSHLCRDPALDAERAGKHRVRFRRAFRSRASRCCAR